MSPAVRRLLRGYHELLEQVDRAGAIMWLRLRATGPGRRLAIPTSRRLVEVLLVRRLGTQLARLQRRRYAALALDDHVEEARADLDALENFQRALPRSLGAAVLLALALTAFLLAGIGVGRLVLGSGSDADLTSELLGTLTSAALSLDPASAVRALQDQHPTLLDVLGSLIVLAWSGYVVILALLPAVTLEHRLVRDSPAGVPALEAEVFAQAGASRRGVLQLRDHGDLLLSVVVAVSGLSSLAVALSFPAFPVSADRVIQDLVYLGIAAGAVAAVVRGARARSAQRLGSEPPRGPTAVMRSCRVLVWVVNAWLLADATGDLFI